MQSMGASASLLSAFYKFQPKRKVGGGGGSPRINLPRKSASRVHGHQRTLRSQSWHHGAQLYGSKINNVVKVSYINNKIGSHRRITRMVDYVLKREHGREETQERKFWDRDRDDVPRDEVLDSMLRNRGQDAAMFTIILSPNQNELDLKEYTREIMDRFEDEMGFKTDWFVVKHENTEHHHVHILMPGRNIEGRSFRLEREDILILRGLANEHQYELQDRDYQYEKMIEQEYRYDRDDFERLFQFRTGQELMRELEVTLPDERDVMREILPPTYFDEREFQRQLQEEIASRNDSKAIVENPIAEEPKNDSETDQDRERSPFDILGRLDDHHVPGQSEFAEQSRIESEFVRPFEDTTETGDDRDEDYDRDNDWGR